MQVLLGSQPQAGRLALLGQTVQIQRLILHVALDLPVAGAVTLPFALAGWAVERRASPTRAATMGIVRGDVGAHFNEQPLAAGFERSVTGLPAGRYTITAYGHFTATNSFEATASVEVGEIYIGDVGSFILDTTTLTNGLHQIEWRVTDSLGRVQGIGSRFIYVQN